jgi:AcrR family transcriptional regulator
VKQNKVISNIKDQELVKRRRDQIIKASAALFKEKGFHRTTTREIARASGFSIGTLYEYIRTKEDILFLTCDALYDKVRLNMEAAMEDQRPSREKLVHVIKSFFYLMEDLQEEILVLYQEVNALSKEKRSYILNKEKEMVHMLERAIVSCGPQGLDEKDVVLLANNLFVQGHMWAFRRWIIQKQFSLEEYTNRQIKQFSLALSENNVD